FLNLYYPVPNFTSSSTANNYRVQVPTTSETNGYDVRIDQNFSSRHQIFGRWSWKRVEAVRLNGLLPSQPQTGLNRNLTVADTFTINPTLLNEFRFGLSNFGLIDDTFPLKGKDVVAALGITGLDLTGPNISGNGPFPGIDFSDGTGFTSVAAGTDANGH